MVTRTMVGTSDYAYDPLKNLTDACGDIIPKKDDDPETVKRCVRLFKRMIRDAGNREAGELSKFKMLASKNGVGTSSSAQPSMKR